MSYWVSILEVAVLGLGVTGGWLVARRMARRAGLTLATVLRRARWLYLLPLLASGLYAAEAVAFVSPEIAWRVPLWLEYHYDTIIRLCVLLLLGFGFGLTVAVAFSEGHRQRWRLVTAGLLVTTAVMVAQATWTRPIAAELGESERDGVVLQTHGASCAAATAANLLRMHGEKASERAMATLLGTSARGTSTAELVAGLGRRGYACQRLSAARLVDVSPPAILYVDATTGPESHAILFVGTKQGLATVLDPLGGKVELDAAEMAKLWHGHGVVCRRS